MLKLGLVSADMPDRILYTEKSKECLDRQEEGLVKGF